jgi:NADH-quinone oxidoreductase subunit L
MDFVIQHSYLIPLLPLIGAAAAGFFGARHLRHNSHWPIWLGVGASAVLSIVLLLGMLGRWDPHAHGGAGHGDSESAEATESAAAEAQHAPEGQNAASDQADAEGVTAAAAHASNLYKSPTIAERRHWFTWIRAGERQEQQKDAAGRSVFDAAGKAVYTRAPAFVADAAFFFDPLTAVMLCVICGIGFLITVFAKGYMAGEEGYFRFFAYLGLFIFMMTLLVMGDNLVMLYLGWEGVGLCSYLLIGYYYDKPSAREAAKKAFLVNRVGDFGFGLGIMLCYLAFGTVSYFGDPGIPNDGLLEKAALAAGDLTGTFDVAGFQRQAMQWIPYLLMLGAFGKSAQFPLYVWLPDAMEGPTPVSALIHAATMVTAGVYMIVRCSTLFFNQVAIEAHALTTIAVVGAFTAIFAATIALRQFDLKKVFAYSTVSQLGFMFVGVAVLAPVAGVFHLVTHAFFKALLFLSSGVVMHAMAGVLDMREMSGLKRVLPWTRRFILVGCLALAGVPLFSGFFSKDEIVAAAMDKSAVLGIVLLVTAFLTAYYTFRLYFRVFEGPEVIPAAPAGGHGHGHAGHGHAADAHAADAHAADAHATASAVAVQQGTAAESGVDDHLAKDAHHGQAVRDHGHGHGAPAHGHGQSHAHDHGHHNHEPMSMMLPLAILTIGAFAAGYLQWPHRDANLGHFLGHSPSLVLGYQTAQVSDPIHFGLHARGAPPHQLVEPIMIVSGVISLLGIGLAYMMHLRDRARAERLAAGMPAVTRLLEGKYWVDEIYQAAIVEPLRMGGRAFFAIDRYIVDGVVNLLGLGPQVLGSSLKLTIQRGYLQGYAATMLFGIAIILLVVFL